MVIRAKTKAGDSTWFRSADGACAWLGGAGAVRGVGAREDCGVSEGAD
jgi:hypothetical protein